MHRKYIIVKTKTSKQATMKIIIIVNLKQQ